MSSKAHINVDKSKGRYIICSTVIILQKCYSVSQRQARATSERASH